MTTYVKNLTDLMLGGHSMVNGDSKLSDDEMLDILRLMREDFRVGQYDDVMGKLEQFEDIDRVRSGIRVEVVCLAARALIAKRETRRGRQLLKKVVKRDYSSSRLYGYVAMAMLELGDYSVAAELCRKAAVGTEAESMAGSE